jgi:hypothetical protein
MNTTFENPEQATIRGFVVRARQGLYLALLSDRANRSRLTDRLLSGRDLDPEAAAPVAEDERKPKQIAERLQRLGAGETCHVMSSNSEIDRKELVLDKALTKVVGKGSATLLSCVAGRLAYFESADGDQYVLRSSGSRKSGPVG